MAEERPKFAMTMAKIFVEKEVKKPFFGKPYIVVGAYFGIAGYLFQQCALLARRLRYSDRVSFMRVFVANEGKELTAQEYLEGQILQEIIPYLSEARTFHDLVTLRERDRIHSTDDIGQFFLKHGKEKLPQPQTAMLTAGWASFGGILGLNEPEIVRDLYEESNKPNPLWEEAYRFGVVSTAHQNRIDIGDAEDQAVLMFTEYCKEFYPELLGEFLDR